MLPGTLFDKEPGLGQAVQAIPILTPPTGKSIHHPLPRNLADHFLIATSLESRTNCSYDSTATNRSAHLGRVFHLATFKCPAYTKDVFVVVNYTMLNLPTREATYNMASRAVRIMLGHSKDTLKVASRTKATILPPGVNQIGFSNTNVVRELKSDAYSVFGLFQVIPPSLHPVILTDLCVRRRLIRSWSRKWTFSTTNKCRIPYRFLHHRTSQPCTSPVGKIFHAGK